MNRASVTRRRSTRSSSTTTCSPPADTLEQQPRMTTNRLQARSSDSQVSYLHTSKTRRNWSRKFVPSLGISMPDSLVGEVPHSWELTSLGEVCERGGGDVQTGPFGSQLHASDYV